jgi:hypothetical protein
MHLRSRRRHHRRERERETERERERETETETERERETETEREKVPPRSRRPDKIESDEGEKSYAKPITPLIVCNSVLKL